MAFHPKLTLSITPIPKDATFSVYGREEIAAENRIHIRMVDEGVILANLRCTPSEALAYAQKITDAANSFTEKTKDS